MVSLFNSSQPEPTGSNLGTAIADLLSQVAPQLRAQQISVDLDMDSTASEVRCDSGLLEAIRNLLDLAILRCPPESELQISACQTIRGIEVEIADSGHSSDAATHAFSPCDLNQLAGNSSAATRLAAWKAATSTNVYCTRCPQGGLAWTLVLGPQAIPHREQRPATRRAA